jgi:hypothetical protein
VFRAVWRFLWWRLDLHIVLFRCLGLCFGLRHHFLEGDDGFPRISRAVGSRDGVLAVGTAQLMFRGIWLTFGVRCRWGGYRIRSEFLLGGFLHGLPLASVQLLPATWHFPVAFSGRGCDGTVGLGGGLRGSRCLLGGSSRRHWGFLHAGEAPFSP